MEHLAQLFRFALRQILPFAEIVCQIIELRRLIMLNHDFPGAAANGFPIRCLPEQNSFGDWFAKQQLKGFIELSLET
jgi:hypothetical protein